MPISSPAKGLSHHLHDEHQAPCQPGQEGSVRLERGIESTDPSILRATTLGPQILGDSEEVGLWPGYLWLHLRALPLSPLSHLGQKRASPFPSLSLTAIPGSQFYTLILSKKTWRSKEVE